MITNLFTPNAKYHREWCGSVAIFSTGLVPTIDFYLTSRFRDAEPSSLFIFDSINFDVAAQRLPMGTFLVIVRHASAVWLQFIEEYRHLWSGVAFLMDDDIPGAVWCRDVPFDYARWTTKRYVIMKRRLTKVCDRVWLSTAALQKRYSQIDSYLIPPQFFGVVRDVSPIGTRRWGYHGTHIHKRELDWLVPIVKRVQRAEPEAEFEVFGDDKIAHKFRDIPRVTVLAPLSWNDYLKHCYASQLAVGVAPMLPGRFNVSRSYTKAFDIARCGAVGIFSESAPYAQLQECAGATLLQSNQDAWVIEVLTLLKNDDLRLSRYLKFLSWIESVSQDTNLDRFVSDLS